MRWQGRRQSDNIDDRRGNTNPFFFTGGLGAVALIAIYILFGRDPNEVIQQTLQQTNAPTQVFSEREEKLASFTKVVLADTEDVWDSIYQSIGDRYQQPTLVLFSGSTSSGCGFASAASGPFYCPSDKQIYIDLSFFDELSQRFEVEGEFAMAYVIAHEVGHHVQQQMGTTTKLQQMKSGISEMEYNRLSVKLELQADFLAGVWAHHAQKLNNILEVGDIEAALKAANAIGDDHLQKSAGKMVNPDAFTHGTSKQRMYWFKKGFETGDITKGNTFSSTELP
ncbi:MAG: neutral zinc metallopeptidase [Sediminibacterium sp.]|nr:neutral zinc metallopeptidase [uncultured Sediminibacterium sp.]